MPYRQITQEERYQLSQLMCYELPVAALARLLGRNRSTIQRVLARRTLERAGPPCLSQGHRLLVRHPAALQATRPPAQRPSPSPSRLSHPGGMLCSLVVALQT
jgi:IS30 family transposase